MFMQLEPPQTLTGLSACRTVPANRSSWRNCATWPRFKVNERGVFAGPPGRPLPPTTATGGTIVTVVASCEATICVHGLPYSGKPPSAVTKFVPHVGVGTSSVALVTKLEAPPQG